MSPPDLSVVVPVFENRDSLDELVDRLTAVCEALGVPYELVLVDDGSRDGSLELLERRAARDPRVRVYPLARNFGGQAAICAGFDLSRGRRIVCLDADLENPPEEIPRLLARLDEGFELVCGVREERRDGWLGRRLPSALLNAWVRRQTGTRVRDIGCGMRAMDARIVRDLAAEGEHRRLVTPLLLRRARSVAEVPIRHQPKPVRGGHSLLTLLAIAVDYYMLTARRPFLVCGLVSAAGLALGLSLLLLAHGTGALAGVVLATGGFVGSVLSLVGEYAQRLYQLGQDLPFYQLRDAEPDGPPVEAPRGTLRH